MHITKRLQIPTLAAILAFVSASTFFIAALPYQLMRREQLNLFLYDSDYIRQTYRGIGSLSRFAGDFVDQFLCYRILGPVLIALILTGIATLAFAICRKALGAGTATRKTGLGRWIPLLTAALVFGWALLRETDNRYLTQYSISVLGYLSIVYLVVLIKTWHRLGTILKTVSAAALLAAGIWAFGKPYDKYYGKPISKPNFLYESVIGMDVEASRENWDKVLELVRKDMHITEVDYYYNLAWAMKGELGNKMLDHSQNYANGVLLTVAEDVSPFTNGMAGEAWYHLGDMSLAEQSTMIALQASPKQTGARFLKRLAEIYLISGETAAAQKYLSMLSRTLRYRRWAESLLAEDHGTETTEWLESHRSKLAKADFVYGDADYRPVLLGLLEANPENRMAREYLLCYDLMYFDVPGFMEDYALRRIPGKMYEEAFLIGLSMDGGLTEQRAMDEGVNPQTYKRMQNYFRTPDRYRNTYWYYYANMPQ